MKKMTSFNHYVQLLEVFTIREIKSRYKASILGPVWIVIYPLLTAFILNIVFGYFIRVDTGDIPYFLFLLSGLVVWNFFQQGLIVAKDALIWNRDLITKSAFPKSTLPLSYVLSKIPDHVVYLFILLLFLLFEGIKIEVNSVLIFILIIPLFLFSAGISLLIALTNAIFRDFGRLVEFLLLILFYITPIVYPETMVPEKFKFILFLNPLSLLIIFSRSLLFNHEVRLDLLLYAFSISMTIFIFGFHLFKAYEKKIADLI